MLLPTGRYLSSSYSCHNNFMLQQLTKVVVTYSLPLRSDLFILHQSVAQNLSAICDTQLLGSEQRSFDPLQTLPRNHRNRTETLSGLVFVRDKSSLVLCELGLSQIIMFLLLLKGIQGSAVYLWQWNDHPVSSAPNRGQQYSPKPGELERADLLANGIVWLWHNRLTK